MISLKIRLLISAAGISAVLAAPSFASLLDDTTNTLEQWVETERQISVSQAEWETEKASIENLISIYTEEIESLTGIIEAAESDTSAAETRRAELLEQDESVKALEAQLVDALIKTEINIKSLEATLPPPLQEELSPLFKSLPEDPATSKLAIGQRIQPIVAILTQVQKFNQVVTVVEGFREFEAGSTVQTEMVYFGLGAAFYVDQANEHAGVAVPGPDGWTWKDDDTLASTVRAFIDIYRGTQQARYIEIPVSVN
ncbi:MAG: DUF3450 family protein [Puniceicoccaceae bacterium]